ncbi:MAG: M20/M25/M40 family metallo-hydrolase, partial [Pseudomonadota bacterium]
MTIDTVLDRIDTDLDAALARLTHLLRIPSISTDPAYAKDCKTAAEWLVRDLSALGVEVEARETPGHPMVVGHVGEGAPHLLFYGHYDVQPVDPLELWSHDPFDPSVDERNGRRVIKGRGAADDKGQLMTFVEACRAWKAVHGSWPCKITFLFEGEEESGSPSLVPFLEANKDELSAPDLALICDTGMFDPDTPAICTSLRGLLGEELTITGANKDLHSGLFGGPSINPIRVLSRIIAALHDDQGRVTVPGFYDGVPELSDDIRAQWDGLGFDPAAFLGAVDLSEPAGEKGRSVLEQMWARPT